MIYISSDSLNETYARHRTWYPDIMSPEPISQSICGLENLIDQFDLVLLDSLGVLCRDNVAIEGADRAIKQLRDKNTPFCVVSNDTFTDHSIIEEKYNNMGLTISSNEVITSLDVIQPYLSTAINRNHIGVIAPLNHPLNHMLSGMVRLNSCQGEIPESIETLLFLTGSDWTEKMQENLVQTAKGRQFELVAGNPDVGVPHGNHIRATTGYFLADFVVRTIQIAKPKLFGKPERAIFSMAMKQYQTIDPSRVLMVGDTLYTDILGGRAMGFATLLLQCGIYRDQNIDEVISGTGITPHYIAPCL